jgi:hypothetical protein
MRVFYCINVQTGQQSPLRRHQFRHAPEKPERFKCAVRHAQRELRNA